MSQGHKRIEKNIGLMAALIVIAVSIGGLVEILPLIFNEPRQPAEGVKPYPALQLAGREVPRIGFSPTAWLATRLITGRPVRELTSGEKQREEMYECMREYGEILGLPARETPYD